ncbi:MAG: hypothetical protein M0P02_08080 [Sulfurospirillaceae bacterium]|jgi:hypothetical protein|nr:hypothetical protein [Sulfurospirillaceae bacterium]MCK9546778.1 hypothetical protein [Sulfurospirillaceae bacterium]MDY0238722.1 hypothetical protein [Campylobacterales bacterium]
MFVTLLPLIGFIALFIELKSQKRYKEEILNSINQIKSSISFKKAENATLIRFFEENGFRVTKSESSIIGKKRLFFISWLFITYGLYFAYFFLFQKPFKIVVDLET